jgi:hypothetical protein
MRRAGDPPPRPSFKARVVLIDRYNVLTEDIVSGSAAIDRETRCIQDVVLDAMVDEHPVQPEPVVACLIAAYGPYRSTPACCIGSLVNGAARASPPVGVYP